MVIADSLTDVCVVLFVRKVSLKVCAQYAYVIYAQVCIYMHGGTVAKPNQTLG